MPFSWFFQWLDVKFAHRKNRKSGFGHSIIVYTHNDHPIFSVSWRAEIGSLEHCFEALPAPFEDSLHVYLKGTRIPARRFRETEIHPPSASASPHRFPRTKDWDLDVLEPSGFKHMRDMIISAVALIPQDHRP